MSERNEQMAAMLAAGIPCARSQFRDRRDGTDRTAPLARNVALDIVVAALATLLLALLAPQLDWLVMLAGNWSSALSQLTGNGLVMLALLVAAFAAWKLRSGAEAHRE